MRIQSSESVERSEMEGDIAKHESSANDEKSFASVEDSGESPEPQMSDHMIPVGFNSPLGCTLVSQDSRVGKNSVLSITSDAKVGQHQHGINRRLKFENTDFSFQFSSGNAGYHGLNASPYMNSTLFSPQSNERHDARTLNDVFPRRMESDSKVREESIGGYFDQLELHNSYATFSKSPHSMKPLLEPVTLNPEMLLQDKRKMKSETVETEKKRKKTAETGESDGCKRCNCKKTKCLKLYCDCFAAGVYCAQSCACQDCFNRTEYDDTVVEIRQQIESRNPLAFSPKIIEHISETPSSILTDAGDVTGDVTPSSGRHKRGCNCKKSKCVKKYCECYQANVGCSDNCRCEECENVHGQKQGYDVMKNLVSKQNISKKLDTAFGLMPPEGDFLQNRLYSMAPFTPAFQDSVRNASGLLSRPWFSGERYLQPPDSNLNYMTQFGHNYNGDRILDHDNRMMDAASFQQGLNRGNAYAMANQFSPYDGLSPQGWMPSNNSLVWRKSPGNLLTSKPADVGGFEDPMYSVVDDAQPVKVSSPNKKRVSPPRMQSEDSPDRSEE